MPPLREVTQGERAADTAGLQESQGNEPGASSRPRPRARFRVPPALGSVLIVLALLVVLQIAGATDIGGQGTLPTTTELLEALFTILTEEGTYAAIGETLQSWAIGFAISVVVGIGLGTLVGLSGFVDRSTRGLFDFLRSTPAIAYLPLAILAIGTGVTFKVTLIVLACVWVILLQTTAGIRSIDPVAVDSARSLRLSRMQRVRWVLLPAALPFVFTGVRLAAIQAFLLSIGVELLAGISGLGQEIVLREQGGAIPELWAFVAVAAGLGVLVSLAFSRAESSLLGWHVSQRDVSG